MPFKSEIVPSAFRRPAPSLSAEQSIRTADTASTHFPMARALPGVSQELTVDLPRNRYFSHLLHHFVHLPYDELNLDLEACQLDLELQWQGRCCRVVVWLEESPDAPGCTHVLSGIVKPFLTDCNDDPAFFTRLLDKVDLDLRTAVDCDPARQRGLSMQALDALLA